jgi:hypothetical protein
MKAFCILSVYILSILTMDAQSLSRVLEAAEKSKATKNYFDAFHKFREALEFEPDNIHFLQKAAESARLLGAYKLSSIYYDSILNHAENNLYPQSAFWSGQMKQIQGDYSNAILSYKIFTTEQSSVDSNLQAIAKKEILACEWAITQVNNPAKGVELSRLSEMINSPYSEFSPVLVNNHLLFSSLRFENTKSKYIPKRYVSSILKSTNYGAAVKNVPDTFVEAGLNLAHCSFNQKYTKVFYTICEDVNDYDKRCDLYYSHVNTDSSWNKGKKLPDHINKSGYTSTQPHVRFDKDKNLEILYFVSNRPGGKGDLDIWYTIIDSLGNYSEPVNFTEINTNQDDITPYFHSKTKTLYYSSKGHLGMGGYDVYSVKETNNKWGIPKNMGVPVNSSFDDVYYTITDRDTLAFMASNRTGSLFLDDATEACCLDIFKVKTQSCEVRLDALVFNYYTQAAIQGATVKLYDLDRPYAEPIIITNDSTNIFTYQILCDKNYKLVASKINYLPDSVTLYSGQPGEFPEITKKLFLKPTLATLEVLTFNKNSGAPLSGVLVELIDLDNPGNPTIKIQNDTSNIFVFPVKPCNKYKIIGSKEEFASAQQIFTIDCGADGVVQQKLYLPSILFSFLPVNLYFNNDRPNPATLSMTTQKRYSETYREYIKEQALFKKNYEKISGPIPDSIENVMDSFFTAEVTYGYNRFKEFLKVLEHDLKRGKVYQIFVKGYASPLAKSKYNYNLSQRRIMSVYNEFHAYNNGILKKYIKNGQLKLDQKPFGESTAPPGISDVKSDLRSIYTIEASRERRVEIIEIKE